MQNKIYMGVTRELVREVFRATKTPSRKKYPEYLYVVGPFRTVRAAKLMALIGSNNPHCTCVSQAEALAKLIAHEGRLQWNQ